MSAKRTINSSVSTDTVDRNVSDSQQKGETSENLTNLLEAINY